MFAVRTKRQAAYALAALAALWVSSRIDYHRLYKLTYPLLALVGLHLLMVVRLGINEWPMPGRLVNKKTYVREYHELTKKTGIPFVPDAVWKDFNSLDDLMNHSLSGFIILTEYLWEMLGEKASLLRAPWPKYDPALAKEDEVEIPVQINGKLRSRIIVPAEAPDDSVSVRAQSDDKIATMIAGKRIVKVIVVSGKLVNIVVR